MRAWKKGAVIGGLWGLVSVLQAFYDSDDPIFYTLFEKIAFFPFYFEMTTIYRSPLGIINYAPPVALLFVILIGALIGSIIGYAIDKYKQKP
jgi:ribose/xylose/arabinose/galactoside ABC-type transport system permease subunit